MAVIIFWTSILFIFYIYAGYPLTVFILSRFLNRCVRKSAICPSVSILIAAYNEEDNIEATIRNKLHLDYPVDKIEIIVISDGSTDGTDDIVKQFDSSKVRLLRQEPRAGKTSALNMAVPKAKGEILVFSDANSIYAKDALHHLVSNFADSTVGYVTGKMIYVNPDGSPIGDGCSAYMKYENFLREAETRVGSIVGVDGGIDAVRKELYRPMNPDQLPDFVLPLMVVDQGYRVVYEPAAILKEPALKAPRDEYRMRVRVSLRALWALWDMRHLLIARRSQHSHVHPFTRSHVPNSAASQPPSFLASQPPSLYAYQLWSHKVLRYLAFVFLIAAYISNMMLWHASWGYKALFVIQNIFYLAALAAPVLEKYGFKSRVLYLTNYFTLLNAASAHASIKFLLRQKMITWTPRKG